MKSIKFRFVLKQTILTLLILYLSVDFAHTWATQSLAVMLDELTIVLIASILAYFLVKVLRKKK